MVGKISKRELSKEKELLLSIILISGEISGKTIRAMKKDISRHKVEKVLIHDTKNDGYIKRDGEGHSNYGYVLTPEGLEYISHKFPEKYNYDLFRKSVNKVTESVKDRYRRSSYCLYWLSKHGILLESNLKTLEKIIQGERISVDTPFFVSLKELAYVVPKLRGSFGSTSLGIIVSDGQISITYYPDNEHRLLYTNEEALTNTVSNAFSHAVASNGNPYDINLTFLFDSDAAIIDSFKNNTVGDGRVSSTRRVYEAYKNKTTRIVRMHKDVEAVFTRKEEDTKIDEVFFGYYGLKPFQPRSFRELCVKEYYDEAIPTFFCWKLSPSTIVKIFDYIDSAELGRKDTRFLIIRFEEQSDLLKGIFSIKKSWVGHVGFAAIPRQNVVSYVEGKSTELG